MTLIDLKLVACAAKIVLERGILCGRVAASADRPSTVRSSAIADPTNYALDVGGAFNISRNIAVTGGVKYKIERDQVATLRDQRRDSQAVYIGTAVKF